MTDSGSLAVTVRHMRGVVLSSAAKFFWLADWGTMVSGSDRFGEREEFLKVTESLLLPVSRLNMERVHFLSEN